MLKLNYIKIFIICILFALFIFFIFLYNIIDSNNGDKNLFLQTDNNKRNKKSLIKRSSSIKLNTYNIFMNKVRDFYGDRNLILLPGKDCKNQNMKTFFFKPKYPKTPYKFIKFQKKNFSLEISNEKPSAFVDNNVEIRAIFLKRLGFKINNEIDSKNLYIAPYVINNTFKKKIKPFLVNQYHKLNRFFNYEEYSSKSLLYINYKQYEKKYPSDYNYMLETYSYPEERDKIKKKFHNYTLKAGGDIWLIKPKLGSLGKKIGILKNLSNIKLKNYVITKYLYNSYLIKGYKNDFRFHGLISSIKPLKLYLYNEGLVRLASEKHNFSALRKQNKYAILSNLFINKKNKDKFIYPKNNHKIEDSNLWNLETFQKYCQANNINFEKIFSEIADIFVKAIISVRGELIKEIEKNKLDFNNFYNLIGFDIIFDENLKPYLLEMNRRCGFRDDNDAEKYYTYNIIADTLNIIGIRPNYLDISNKYKNKDELLKKNLEESLCELDRPRGGYKLIFPLKNNYKNYKQFFGKNIPEEDQNLWKNLID